MALQRSSMRKSLASYIVRFQSKDFLTDLRMLKWHYFLLQCCLLIPASYFNTSLFSCLVLTCSYGMSIVWLFNLVIVVLGVSQPRKLSHKFTATFCAVKNLSLWKGARRMFSFVVILWNEAEDSRTKWLPPVLSMLPCPFQWAFFQVSCTQSIVPILFQYF